jgi:nucleotide-binding universal stress UspA family protein
VSEGRRVLVATDHERRPTTALEHASDLAGPQGEVVLASVLVVPHSQPLTAALDRSVTSACEMLDEEKGRTAMPNGAAAQIQTLLDKATATVMLVRPAPIS